MSTLLNYSQNMYIACIYTAILAMNSLYSLLYSQEHPGGYSGYAVYTARAQSPIHPINKPSKRRLTIVKSQNRRLGDLGQMVPSGRILIFRARERHIGYAHIIIKKCHWPVGQQNCRNCQRNCKDLAKHNGPSSS